MKNPYTIIVGDNERDNKMVSYREYGSEETKSLSIKDFIELIREKNKKRQLILDKINKQCIILQQVRRYKHKSELSRVLKVILTQSNWSHEEI